MGIGKGEMKNDKEYASKSVKNHETFLAQK